VVSRATIHRILTRHAAVTPDPGKRLRSSYPRFAAEQPNECWQSDFTHYRLRDGRDVDVISWLDDHSRYALHVTAHRRITGPVVVGSFRETVAQYGIRPRRSLTTGWSTPPGCPAGGGGRNGLETELRRLNVVQKNSRPDHPTTCGKVERFQQTMKKAAPPQASP